MSALLIRRKRGKCGLASLEDALPLLSISDQLILGLPLGTVVAQRLRLPTVDPQEFAEMVRIQIEKAVPYSLDELTTDFEIIEQTEADCVVSAVAVHNGRLSEMAAPLLDRGFIPNQVTVYAAQRTATHAAVRSRASDLPRTRNARLRH